jgi:ketosteroid isomerase-like protein
MAEDMERAVKMIRESYEAFNRGDYDAAAANLHPDVNYTRVSDVESALEGRDAVRENMEPDVWEKQVIEVHGMDVIGEQVVVETTFHAVGRGSGIELHQAGYHLWRIVDGKGAEFRFFLDRAEALAVAREHA